MNLICYETINALKNDLNYQLYKLSLAFSQFATSLVDSLKNQISEISKFFTNYSKYFAYSNHERKLHYISQHSKSLRIRKKNQKRFTCETNKRKLSH